MNPESGRCECDSFCDSPNSRHWASDLCNSLAVMASIKRHERHRVPNPYNLDTFLGSGRLETPLLSPDASCTNVPALKHTPHPRTPYLSNAPRSKNPNLGHACPVLFCPPDMATVLHRTSLFEKLNPGCWREYYFSRGLEFHSQCTCGTANGCLQLQLQKNYPFLVCVHMCTHTRSTHT